MSDRLDNRRCAGVPNKLDKEYFYQLLGSIYIQYMDIHDMNKCIYTWFLKECFY